MNKKKIAVATALAGLVLWTIAPSKAPRTNRVLANAFPAKLLAAPSSCTTPEWPKEARRYEVEGITLLHFHINADGAIEDARVAASSSWKLLDDAALASLIKCKFKANLDETERDATFPIQFVWTLAGPPSNRPRLVPDSCAASPRFSGFEEFNRTPSSKDGVLVRFLVTADGTATGVKAEGVDDVLASAAADYIASCTFATDPTVPGEKTDTAFGRVLRKRP
ncbi:energy transducer TonB [Massilia sp. CF038]|uniref:energy transducer TonB n=1 Tax=Massilia sp. CF038 TaxID=1881045 RepID=UPI00091B4CF4|nr:energy transducer TonB [Massilia sp. CF038]SHH05280.1 TonB family C-terminal domain-containing protein [Massilia sp. CF038]